MKKTIFAIVLMVAAVLFASCQGGGKNSAVKSISFSATELTLTPGQETRLKLVVEPENAKYNADDVVWSSSDTAVAVVSNNGTITALEKGTSNIKATLGDLTAVCALSVKSWEENLAFTGMVYWVESAEDSTYYGDAWDTIQSTSGENYYVQKMRATVEIFTAGFYINNSGQLAGSDEGGIIEGFAPIYYAPAAENHKEKPTVFTLGYWFMSDTMGTHYNDTAMAQVMPCGKINDQYLANMKLFLSNAEAGNEGAASKNLEEAGELGCEGAIMKKYTYHTVEEGYSKDGYYGAYIPDLFIQESIIDVVLDYAASEYMYGIDAHLIHAKALKESDPDDNYNYYTFGCHWHYDQATKATSWVDEEIHWGESYEYYFNNMSNASAAPSRFKGGYQELPAPASQEVVEMVKKAINSVPMENYKPLLKK